MICETNVKLNLNYVDPQAVDFVIGWEYNGLRLEGHVAYEGYFKRVFDSQFTENRITLLPPIIDEKAISLRKTFDHLGFDVQRPSVEGEDATAYLYGGETGRYSVFCWLKIPNRVYQAISGHKIYQRWKTSRQQKFVHDFGHYLESPSPVDTESLINLMVGLCY